MRVLLLCDGGGPLGVGHVLRSLALAEAAVAAGHDVVVAGHFEGAFLLRQLAAAPAEVVLLEAHVPGVGTEPLLELMQRFEPDILHVDSYEPRGWFLGMVVSNMEDGTFGRRAADVVIDPTLGAERSTRPDDGSTWLLRGSRYAPMRQRVTDARQRTAHDTNETRAVLVVMGGTDPVGLAPAAVELLARTGLALDVTVIAVGENAEQVRAAANGTALSLSVQAPVDDLAALMSGQDLVISAAGTTIWELCCIGVPMAVVWAVDNQREGYERVVEAGAAVGLGGPELGEPGRGEQEPGGHEAPVDLLRTALTDPRVRSNLVLAGRQIVDGLGAWRVVRMWEQAQRLGASAGSGSTTQEPSSRLTARRAGMDDARLLWEWRNDPDTRASSRDTDLVLWPRHLAWLERGLAREDLILLVMEDPAHDGLVNHGGPVGTVRWDLGSQGEWEVSITVSPERRGQSLARPLLRAAEVALCEMLASRGTHAAAYLAVVHVDNSASVRLFETSGYVPDLPPDPAGFMRFRKPAPVA